MISDRILRKLKSSLNLQWVENYHGYSGALAYLGLPEVIDVQNFVSGELVPNEIGKGHIHRNDMMFHYHLFHFKGNIAKAVNSHFEVGNKIASAIFETAEKFGIKSKRILDFGSGYGRVSRFLPGYFPRSEFIVSDVKKGGLSFQKKYLGFNIIEQSARPDDFTADDKFDLIFAISVFTHLPETLFLGWYNKLLTLLKPGGAIIMTYNDSDIYNKEHKGRLEKSVRKTFYYRPVSEESILSFIPDAIQDYESYGQAMVKKSYLRELVNSKQTEIFFLEGDIAPGQQACLFRKL